MDGPTIILIICLALVSLLVLKSVWNSLVGQVSQDETLGDGIERAGDTSRGGD